MTTLSQHNSVPDAASLAALPRLPRDDGGPVFREPWEAQAFALAVKLSEEGHFTWKEWAAALADELKAAADRGEPDDGTHYYEHWLATLERLVMAKGLERPRLARRPQRSLGRRVPAHPARQTCGARTASRREIVGQASSLSGVRASTRKKQTG